MNKIYLSFYLFILIISITAIDYPKYPVFNLKYNTAFGTDEDEESGELLTATTKHNIIFNLKEEISKAFYFNIPFQYTTFEYSTSINNFYYFKCSPYLSYDITDLLNLKFYLAAKWANYALLDANYLSKDYFYVDSKIQFSYKILKDLKLNSYFKCAYDLYNNPQKMMQAYNLQLELESKISQFTISGAYNGKIRLPLGEASTKVMNFLNTFAINAEYDPNKKADK